MRAFLNTKIKSASQKYQKDGIGSLLKLYPRRLYKKIISFDKFWGHVVEIKRNVVKIEGLKFKVNVPTISRKDKAKFLFDRYERPERIAIKQFLVSTEPVVEFGANIGIVACLTNKKLKNPQKHIVVEANPELIPFLEQNRDLNKCQFQIINSAVAHGVSEVSFNISEDILGSSVVVKSERSITVPAITFKEIIEQSKFDSCVLICDIEGAEIDLIKNESEIIKEKVSTIFMEVHPKFTGQTLVEEMKNHIISLGFSIKFDRWSNLVFQNKNLQAASGNK